MKEAIAILLWLSSSLMISTGKRMNIYMLSVRKPTYRKIIILVIKDKDAYGITEKAGVFQAFKKGQPTRMADVMMLFHILTICQNNI